MGKPKTNSHVTNAPEAVGIRVFVYGTLKRHHYNHTLLEDTGVHSDFLGACYIKGPYQMRDMTWFPGVQHLVNSKLVNRIYGEVYRITPETLKSLDILEGNGHFFTRSQVETPWKKAWMYMIPASFNAERPVISSGVWKPCAQESLFIHNGAEKMDADEYYNLQPPAVV